MSIYGLTPAPYSEDNPDDLFLKNLPSLEQIASFNLANQQNMNNNPQTSINRPQGLPPVPNISTSMSTPATTIGSMPADISNSLMPDSNWQSSASSEIPGNNMQSNGNITQLITDYSKPYPVTAESIQYLNGFIRTQIGRRAQIQFLMGNSDLVEKDGFLLGVGANYILINEIGTNDITACDFYNIKFIRFLY